MSNDTSVTAREIHAYLDDELSSDRVEAVAAALGDDAALRTEREQMRGLNAVVCASLEAEARAVPAARFEQIWDEIDRAIERDTRLQAEAERGTSLWSRLWAAFKPVRVPALAAVGAAAVTLVVVNIGSEPPNKTESVASVEAPAPEPEASPSAVPAVEPTKLADAESAKALPAPQPKPEIDPMPIPENSDAEIHGIEFGGKNGRIGHSGTVTVLYVEEDDTQSTNSERSL